jgi:hypothetical protein
LDVKEKDGFAEVRSSEVINLSIPGYSRASVGPKIA